VSLTSKAPPPPPPRVHASPHTVLLPRGVLSFSEGVPEGEAGPFTAAGLAVTLNAAGPAAGVVLEPAQSTCDHTQGLHEGQA
jgi:hypothetical protein